MQTGSKILPAGIRTGAPPLLSKFDIDAARLISRMTVTPSYELSKLINKTFIDLKSAGIYSSLVQFTKANIHNETDAKLNWVSTLFPITTVGSPTFTAKSGWKTTTSKYLKAGFIPSTQIKLGIIGEQDCGFLIDKTGSTGELQIYKIHGCFKYEDNTLRFQFNNYTVTNKKCNGYLNCSTNGTINKDLDVASVNGIFYLERIGGKIKGYYEKIEVSDYDVITSSALVDQELYYGALHTEPINGVGWYSNEYIRTIVLCRYLGPTKQALLYDIIKYFNDNVGNTF